MTTSLPRSLKLTTSIARQFRPVRIPRKTFIHHASCPIKTFSTAPPRFATMPTMKEAIVSAGPKVEIKDSPIPEPGPDDVIIKVLVSGYVLSSIFLYPGTTSPRQSPGYFRAFVFSRVKSQLQHEAPDNTWRVPQRICSDLYSSVAY